MQQSGFSAGGAITSGITPGTFISKTIGFVEEQLPPWRDDSTRQNTVSEEPLNGQLCKFLNDKARDFFPMAFFHHEERQQGRRRVDMSALPTSNMIAANNYLQSIYEPYLVIEGKRLPTPSANRRREYVTGLDKKDGGIQRFRLCLHGASHDAVVMIAYLQSKDSAYWLAELNSWISALEKSGEDKTCTWNSGDRLKTISHDAIRGVARSESGHLRNGVAGIRPIAITHLWIEMGLSASAAAHPNNSN